MAADRFRAARQGHRVWNARLARWLTGACCGQHKSNTSAGAGEDQWAPPPWPAGRNLGGRIRREPSRTSPDRAEVEPLTWPFTEMPGRRADRTSMGKEAPDEASRDRQPRDRPAGFVGRRDRLRL